MQIDKESDTITILKYEGFFYWFSCFKEMWVMDRVNWMSDFLSTGITNFDTNDHSERYNIAILCNENVDDFLIALKKDGYQLSLADLSREFHSRLLPDANWWDIYDLLPDLLIDFDAKVLYSQEVNGMHYEKYVPIGWDGFLKDFCDNESDFIPLAEKYWVVDGSDYRQIFIDNYDE